MALNLEKQLCFYGKYHHNKINVAIHTVCVPLILFSFIALGTNTPPLIPLPNYLTVPNLPLNGGTIFALIYCLLYILLEPVAGSLLVPIILGSTAYSKHLTSTNPELTNYTAIGIFLVSWVLQFVGHGVFEKRSPALFDNLVQALALAPFFVWMKVLFRCGYRPELQARVEKDVQKELKDIQSKGKGANGKAN